MNHYTHRAQRRLQILNTHHLFLFPSSLPWTFSKELLKSCLKFSEFNKTRQDAWILSSSRYIKKGTQSGWFLLDHISSAMSQKWSRHALIKKAIFNLPCFSGKSFCPQSCQRHSSKKHTYRGTSKQQGDLCLESRKQNSPIATKLTRAFFWKKFHQGSVFFASFPNFTRDESGNVKNVRHVTE